MTLEKKIIAKAKRQQLGIDAYTPYFVMLDDVFEILKDAQQVSVEPEVKPACETLQRRFELYQRCVNQIDDYLEYAYKTRDAEEIKKTIMGYIDLLTQKLSKSV